MRRRFLVIIILVVVVLLVGFVVVRRVGSSGAFSRGGGANESAEEENRIPVGVWQVRRGDLQKDLFLVGDMSASSRVDVFPKVGGVVEEIALKEGDRVSKNQIIAQIEKDEARLGLEQAEAALRSAQVSLENLGSERKRLRELHANGGASKQQLDSVETQYDTTQAQIDQSAASVKLARIRFDNTSIKAPISGIIADIAAVEGSTALLSSPLATVIDIDIVVIEVNVIEKDIPLVKVGQRAGVRVDTYPDEIFFGRVANTATVIDPRTRTVKVEVEVNNPNHLLKPGMFASVNVTVSERVDAVILPVDAIVRREDLEQVFIVQDDKALLRTVETGITEGDSVEIVEGVEAGQIVVVVGNRNLAEGDNVLVVEGGSGE